MNVPIHTTVAQTTKTTKTLELTNSQVCNILRKWAMKHHGFGSDLTVELTESQGMASGAYFQEITEESSDE